MFVIYFKQIYRSSYLKIQFIFHFEGCNCHCLSYKRLISSTSSNRQQLYSIKRKQSRTMSYRSPVVIGFNRRQTDRKIKQ